MPGAVSAMEHTATAAPFERGMADPLLRLFASQFPAGDPLLDPALHEWLYCGNPYGIAKAVTVVTDDKCNAFLAMVPVTLARGGVTKRAYYVVNVLVDPECRGQNLFLKMIDAAVDLAKAEGAMLMGHPNAAALRFWQRKRMHFVEDLRPFLALPAPSWGAVKVARAETPEILRDLGALPQTIPGAYGQWKVAADAAYLEWRYLRHPINRYAMQMLEFGNGARGVQVTRRIGRARLLIDRFVDPANAARAFHALPFPSVCFLPESARARGLLALPLKKRLPVFVTDFAAPGDPAEFAQLGLSASDF